MNGYEVPINISAHIGPHNGKELELMLAGDKPFAVFSAEPGMAPASVGDAGFAPYVEAGQILLFVHVDKTTGIESRRYCLPSEEWRAKLSQLLWEMCLDGTARERFTPADLHRLEGTLLAYPKESIEVFVERSAALRRQHLAAATKQSEER